jgi:hypothetical protein
MSTPPTPPAHRHAGPGRRPFGAVTLAWPIAAVPPPATVRHPPNVRLGPSVPLAVLSFEALRRLP